MPRLIPIDPSQWNAEQRERCQRIVDATGSYNLTGTFLHHWEAFKAMTGWGAHIIGPGSTLNIRLRELIILRLAFKLPCEYEWAQHKPQARKVGITDEEIERIKDGGNAAGWTDVESALLDMTDDLVSEKKISDPVWDRLQGLLTTKQIFDGIYLVGNYITVAMLANSAGVEIEKGLGFTGFDPDRVF